MEMGPLYNMSPLPWALPPPAGTEVSCLTDPLPRFRRRWLASAQKKASRWPRWRCLRLPSQRPSQTTARPLFDIYLGSLGKSVSSCQTEALVGPSPLPCPGPAVRHSSRLLGGTRGLVTHTTVQAAGMGRQALSLVNRTHYQ